ncbi:hypothetical protein [Saccharolobus islandicus]|uniref:Uncharacterized protein n=1 Tax=Saccharolobus islandicus (strain M.16.4 / Kamchatka \|nr:hypothetical protein [Sulfolobus islandicus]ACR42201.1 hypothetical protein M164_1601 [Sulfolobus islandicus M.16.4]
MRVSGRKIEEFCIVDDYYNEHIVSCFDAKISVDDVEFSDKDLEEIVDQYEEEIVELLKERGYRISESTNKNKVNLQDYKKLEEWMK